MQNFGTRDSLSLDIMDSQDDFKDLLIENNTLKEQYEQLIKIHQNEKFTYEEKIKSLQNKVSRLTCSLNSANQMLEVYKVIDKQNENNYIKEMVEKLGSKIHELEQINLALKKENADLIIEIEALNIKKINFRNDDKKIEVKNHNRENFDNGENFVENEKNLREFNKNFNSIYSTNQCSSFNGNLPIQLSSDTIFMKSDNNVTVKQNSCVSENNDENSKNNDKKSKNKSEMSDSDSTSSDISFSSKNPQQIKKLFIKLKNEKEAFYENAVNIITENEIEIEGYKTTVVDYKNIIGIYEEKFTYVQKSIKNKFNINLPNLEDIEEELLLPERINEECESYNEDFNSNYFDNLRDKNKTSFDNLNKNLSQSNKNINDHLDEKTKRIYFEKNKNKEFNENENEKFNTESNDAQEKGLHDEYNSEAKSKKFSHREHYSNSKKYREEEGNFNTEKQNNTFENELNEYRFLIENLESKLVESTKNYEEKISKLNFQLENLESEKNSYMQELETINSNKKNLVNDIEYYSATARSLQDQKEKLEDILKNRIDFLIEEKKNLEQSLSKYTDQNILLEKEIKELREKQNNNVINLKEKFVQEKEILDAKMNELTNRFFDCNKEKELLRKENENIKQILERKKFEFEELIKKKIRAKEKKHSLIEEMNEKFKIYIEKLESGYNEKIEGYRNKIKSLNTVIQQKLEIINSLTKDIKVESQNKNVNLKLKRTKSLIENNFNQMQKNFKEIFNVFNKENTPTNENMTANVDISQMKNNINLESNTIEERLNESEGHVLELDKKEYLEEEKLKENENDVYQMYGIDSSKQNTYCSKNYNSLNFYSELNNNLTIPNMNEDEAKVSLACALEEEKVKENKKDKNNIIEKLQRLKSKQPNLNHRRSSINLFNKALKESIKKKIKQRLSKKATLSISKQNSKSISELTEENDKMRKQIEDLQNRTNEEIRALNDMIQIKELKEINLIITQENKNLKEEIEILKIELINIEKIKTEYINKLMKDIEKTEDIAANAKLSLCQFTFEKDNEILKYKNYCKKLKITIKNLEINNKILSDDLHVLNSKILIQNKK